MTKEDLKRLLSRNHSLADANKDLCKILAAFSQCRTPDEMVAVEKGTEQSVQRPIIRFTFLRSRLLDADGYRGGEKDLLDGLQKAGLIPDDKETDIELLPPSQKKVSKRSEEGTIIEIEL